MWIRVVLPMLVGFRIGMVAPALGLVATVALELGAITLSGRVPAVRARPVSMRDGHRVD